MNLDDISQNNLGQLERCVTELLLAMRKAKLQNEALFESLKELEHKLGEIRRERFDAVNSDYGSY